MKLRDFTGLERIVLLYVCAGLLMSFQANLFRLSGIPFFRAIYFDQIFLGYLVLSLVCFVFSLRKPLTEVPFVIILVLFCLMVVTIGVFRFNDDPVGGLRYYALPVFIYMLLLGRNFVVYFYTSKFFWTCMLIFHGLGLLYYFAVLIGSVYPGIGVQSIAFAAIFFISQGHWILFLLALAMIFLEGKRSILLSLLITLVFLRLVKFNTGMRLVYSVVAACGAILILSVLLMVLAGVEGSTTINRINFLNPFSENYDLFLGSSGRMGELVSFFGTQNLFDLLVGAGSDFQYEWSLGYASEQDGEIKGYFHMSAANYIAAGGIVGLSVFIYMMLLPFRAGRLDLPENARKTAYGLGFFSIVQSFFGFSLATDAPSLIFILGPAMILGNQIARRRSQSGPVFPLFAQRTSI